MLKDLKGRIINMFTKCHHCEVRGRNYIKVHGRRFCSPKCLQNYIMTLPIHELRKRESEEIRGVK